MNWKDVEKRALFDPVLQAAVTQVRMGQSREEALIEASLKLSEIKEQLLTEKLDAWRREPALVRLI